MDQQFLISGGADSPGPIYCEILLKQEVDILRVVILPKELM